ncbi:uncharacterized protein [Apostichopus japonicus]|uniref:uncharacterized protein isoform X2 n=1 Tax=Stichopus japonicus TaxID=307972 RepID=UPI003AB31BAF
MSYANKGYDYQQNKNGHFKHLCTEHLLLAHISGCSVFLYSVLMMYSCIINMIIVYTFIHPANMDKRSCSYQYGESDNGDREAFNILNSIRGGMDSQTELFSSNNDELEEDDGHEEYGDEEYGDEEDEEEVDEEEVDEVLDDQWEGKVKPAALHKKSGRIIRKCPLCQSDQVRLGDHLRVTHKIPLLARRKILYENGLMHSYIHKSIMIFYWLCRVPISHAEKQRTSKCYQSLLDTAKWSKPNVIESQKKSGKNSCTDDEDLDPCLEQFKKYETAKHRGTPAAKKALQHFRQLQILMERLHLSIRQLMLPSTAQKTVELLNDDGKQPKTIQCYLLSLKKLANFLAVNTSAASTNGVTVASADRMVRAVDDFVSSMRPEALRREKFLRSQIAGILLSQEAIKKFKKASAEEVNGLLSLCTTSSLDWAKIRRYRNLIIANILLHGGCRSGVVTNMTLGEFGEAEDLLMGQLESFWVIKVSQHKTSATYGPAQVVLPNELYNWCRAYITNFRLQTPNASSMDHPSTPLFIGVNGKAVLRVAQDVERIGASLGVQHLTPVNIRKTSEKQLQPGLVHPSLHRTVPSSPSTWPTMKIHRPLIIELPTQPSMLAGHLIS